MKVAAIIQARMSSERLPGKVLRKIEGKPVLAYLLEGLRRSAALEGVIVATSTQSSDSEIRDFCKESGVDCHSGSLPDVASRFKEIIEMRNLDAFVRVNADSPLLDYRIIDRGIGIFKSGLYDLVTNIQKRTYPRGQSVEVLRSSVFIKGYAEMREAEDFEHVTRFFYDKDKGLKVCNFAAENDYSGIRLCLDTRQDLEFLTAVIGRMRRPHWEYDLEGLIELCRQSVIGPQQNSGAFNGEGAQRPVRYI